MAKTEEDLSPYIAYHSTISNNLALISGFIFTAIVLLLTLLPDPGQPLVQLTLFVMLVAFNLIVFQLFGEEALLGYCATVAPKLPKKHPTRAINTLSPFVWILLGVVSVMMFLVLELIYLALASAVMTIATGLVGYRIVKPMLQWQQWKRVDLHESESTD